MNYTETMCHLTNIIAEQEGCSRTIAHKLLAAALNTRTVRTHLLFTISSRGKPNAELPLSITSS